MNKFKFFEDYDEEDNNNNNNNDEFLKKRDYFIKKLKINTYDINKRFNIYEQSSSRSSEDVCVIEEEEEDEENVERRVDCCFCYIM